LRIRKCMVCGNTFVTTTDKKKTCSPECYRLRKNVTSRRNKGGSYYYYKKKLKEVAKNG
jgi:predicted nucleic acid-binding Zn ribbon protein